MCIYAYTYVCIYVYTYVYVYICIYVYMYVYSMCARIHTNIIYVYIHVYMYICIYVYMHICIYIYTYTCVNLHIFIYNQLTWRSRAKPSRTTLTPSVATRTRPLRHRWRQNKKNVRVCVSLCVPKCQLPRTPARRRESV